MIIDSHCHLASSRFDPAEIPGLLHRAAAAGVDRIVTLATCMDDVEANLSLALNPMIHACVGIHPCDVHRAPDDAPDLISAHAQDPRVCAIGETGLDYYHPAPEGWCDDAYHKRQQDFLTRHFELAAAAKLNLVIHTRDNSGQRSFDDAIAIYQSYHERVRAVFHCFTGSWEQARRVIDLGGLVSFGGVVTFKSATAVRETVRQCPAGSFMLETDAPYLAPEPHRGKRNEPSWTRETAQTIAAVRHETFAELTEHSSRAACRFFRFRPEGN